MSAQQRLPQLLLVNTTTHSGPLAEALGRGGFVVTTADSPADLPALMERRGGWDLVVVCGDPGAAAVLQLCRQHQQQRLAGPLMVLGNGAGPGEQTSAPGEAARAEAARVQALEAGADDVLLQPYGLPECLARCRALVRRHQLRSGPLTLLTCGPIDMVVEEHLVRRNGEVVTLSPREFRLLRFLLAHQGRIWHREELLSRVWGELEALDLDPKTVDVHIHWLRLKLEEDPSRPQLITTVRGRGYRLGP